MSIFCKESNFQVSIKKSSLTLCDLSTERHFGQPPQVPLQNYIPSMVRDKSGDAKIISLSVGTRDFSDIRILKMCKSDNVSNLTNLLKNILFSSMEHSNSCLLKFNLYRECLVQVSISLSFHCRVNFLFSILIISQQCFRLNWLTDTFLAQFNVLWKSLKLNVISISLKKCTPAIKIKPSHNCIINIFSINKIN